ncbi:MAG: InlB B-repeat-containing protein, partial [Eubacteriales bacterium]|nr:InlB B-repeat-containing protein [Eubacteriales bacterium]
MDFNSANVIVKSETIPYEKALSSYNFTPDYPAKLEAGAYKFDGWYTDPGCTSAVDWANAKMPYKNMVVYAKWAPVVHTVTFAKTEGAEAEATQQVNHNELAQGYTTTNGSYTFIGWFYKDANGVEHAFDLSMPVEHDMNLYAKWRTDVLVNYIIHYQLADGTKVADDTIGSAFVLETKTFEAKVGDALYATYAEGYFPDVPSHSIKMENNQANEFAFVYAPAEKVTYTVKYLEKGTNTQLHTPKTMETTKAVVTEIFEPVEGYAVDEYQKRLILTTGKGATNEIIFWYTKDNVHAPVTIIHWTQNIEGEGYTQYQTSTEQGTIGNNYKAEWTTIEGFHKNEGKSNVEGKLVDYKGLVLNLYYDRDMITYKFHFVDNVTGEQIANDIQGEARYGKTVSQEALRIDGYKLANGTPELKAITVGTVSAANEFTFYYIGYFNVVHVKDGGTNKNTTEVDYTQSVIDNGYNLTEAVTPGYLYGGTFDDEKCETVHNFGQENAINFTPVKGETYYIWEVSETYLKPRTYAIWRHDPNNNGRLNVVGLYLMTHADRLNYQFVGFEIVGENATFANKEVYEVVNAKKGDTLYQQIYVNLQGEMAVSNAEVDVTARKAGYIAMYKLDANQFAKFKADGLTFQPYWVTLDGIIVRGVNSRECRYKGLGQTDITVNNKDRNGSSVSNFATPSQQTVEAVSYYAFEAADVEVATPDVPETPEIPEVPEAPEMTLNSGAMYLRAQYTYEMMTNTVKFISAIDVNECTEYGFVING